MQRQGPWSKSLVSLLCLIVEGPNIMMREDGCVWEGEVNLSDFINGVEREML